MLSTSCIYFNIFVLFNFSDDGYGFGDYRCSSFYDEEFDFRPNLTNSAVNIDQLQAMVEEEKPKEVQSWRDVPMPQLYASLQQMVKDEAKSQSPSQSILLCMTPSKTDPTLREQALRERFSGKSHFPEKIQELSCFYKYHAASIDMERLSQGNDPISNSYYDDQLTMIVTRIEASLQLLEDTVSSMVKQPVNRSRPVLNRRSLKFLEEWYDDHLQHPYPTAEQVEFLARTSRLTVDQVKKWFGNKRSRSKNTRSLTEIAKVKRRQKLAVSAFK